MVKTRTMTREQIIDKADALVPWYHCFELVPGYVTISNMLGSVPQWNSVRAVREGLDYAGKSVLDLGTMDGMWAFEAEQLGASQVFAGDIWQASSRKRLDLAREALGSRVVVVPDTDVHCLSSATADYRGLLGFDIIQCLGLLYHVQNPLLALHQIRRCLADDGVMLLETAYWEFFGEIPICRFNSDLGIYNDATTYWCPNMACLLGMLKQSGWVPEMETARKISQGGGIGRVCMICRAGPVDAENVDNWGAY